MAAGLEACADLRGGTRWVSGSGAEGTQRHHLLVWGCRGAGRVGKQMERTQRRRNGGHGRLRWLRWQSERWRVCMAAEAEPSDGCAMSATALRSHVASRGGWQAAAANNACLPWAIGERTSSAFERATRRWACEVVEQLTETSCRMSGAQQLDWI